MKCAACGRQVMPWWKTVLHPGCRYAQVAKWAREMEAVWLR